MNKNYAAVSIFLLALFWGIGCPPAAAQDKNPGAGGPPPGIDVGPDSERDPYQDHYLRPSDGEWVWWPDDPEEQEELQRWGYPHPERQKPGERPRLPQGYIWNHRFDEEEYDEPYDPDEEERRERLRERIKKEFGDDGEPEEKKKAPGSGKPKLFPIPEGAMDGPALASRNAGGDAFAAADQINNPVAFFNSFGRRAPDVRDIQALEPAQPHSETSDYDVHTSL